MKSNSSQKRLYRSLRCAVTDSGWLRSGRQKPEAASSLNKGGEVIPVTPRHVRALPLVVDGNRNLCEDAPDTGRGQVGKCAMGNTHGKGGSTDWVLFRSPWPHSKLLAAWTRWVLHIPFHICAISLLIFLVQSGFRHRALDGLYSPSAPRILPRVPLQTLS